MLRFSRRWCPCLLFDETTRCEASGEPVRKLLPRIAQKWLEQAAWMRRVEGGASGHVLTHVACTGAKRARWTVWKARPRFHTSPSRMYASKTCMTGYLRGMCPILLLVHPARFAGYACWMDHFGSIFRLVLVHSARLSDERADGDGFGGLIQLLGVSSM